MKIFIAGVNTQLGYHLVERLRNDHLLLEGYSIITGTKFQKQDFALHTSVNHCFDFNKQRDQTVKQAIDSDVLIFDIRNNPAPQIEFILKVLKHYNRKKQMQVIGISNFMTWSNAKTMEFIKAPHEKEELLESTLDKLKWRQVSFQRQKYPIRSSHPMFVYNYLLEQQIMQLRHHQKLIKPLILCTGILYGKSGMDLGQQIQNAIDCKESVFYDLKNKYNLTGQDKVPFLHIDELLDTLQTIIYKNQSSAQYEAKQYMVLCENGPKSIIEVVQDLHLCTGHVQNNQKSEEENNVMNEKDDKGKNNTNDEQDQYIPELLFTKDKKIFAFLSNLSFTPLSENKFIGSQPSQNTNTQQQSPQRKQQLKTLDFPKLLISQFLAYHGAHFKLFLISDQLVQQELHTQQEAQIQSVYALNQKEILRTFLQKYLLFDKNKIKQIKQNLIQKGEIPQQRLVTPQQEKKKQKPNPQKIDKKQAIKKQTQQEFLPQIMKKFLTQNSNSNFIICLPQSLLTQMLCLFQEEDFQSFKDLKFILIQKKLDNQNKQIKQVDSKNIQKRIQIFSHQFLELIGILPQHNQNDDEVKNQSESIEPQNQQTQLKDDQEQIRIQPQETKINLLSQYLLDNVILYLSQAKQKLKNKGVLKDGQKFEGKKNIKLFLQELKQIRKRQQALLENQENERKNT